MDLKLLNQACRLAVEVARSGLIAQPSVPAPAALNRVLAFKRLSQTTFAAIRKVVDEDDEFRARVAAEADEAEVGRAGWLWLHRPEGWDAELETLDAASDPAATESVARLRKKLAAAEAGAKRHAQDAEMAVAARLRSDQKVADLLAEAGSTVARNEELEAEVHRLGDERTRVVRLLKEAEAELAGARRDLKAVRQANVEAHADLLALQKQVDERSGDSHETGSPASPVDTGSARRAIDEAALAAARLSEALGEAAAALVPSADTSSQRLIDPSSLSSRPAKKRRTTRRPAPLLPPGVLEGSGAANVHLVRAAALTVVVDAYNVARTAWSGLEPEDERRRTVALLEEVQARSGANMVAVFDGDSNAVAPTASRSIRVQFSPTGVTADDAIADLLGSLPVSQPVLVVSSDKAVARDAHRQGAAVMDSGAFLSATGR